jgi:hypothetical protein
MVFLKIALQVSEQILGIHINYGNLSWMEGNYSDPLKGTGQG